MTRKHTLPAQSADALNRLAKAYDGFKDTGSNTLAETCELAAREIERLNRIVNSLENG